MITLLRINILALLVLLCVNPIWAVKEKYSNEIKAKPLSASASPLVVQDYKFGDATEEAKIDYDYAPQYENLIMVEIVEDNFEIKPVATTYRIDLEIAFWAEGSDPLSAPTELIPSTSFYIDYDPGTFPFADTFRETEFRQYFKRMGNRKMEITVLSVVDEGSTGEALPEMRVYGEIVVNRKYNFNKANVLNNAQPSFSNAVVIQNQTILELDWEHYAGAEAYDLEWTFYDKESKIGQKIIEGQGATVGSINELFRDNASRVTLEKESYRINLLYPEGYLFYRLRAVRNIEGFREVSNWTTDGAVSIAVDGWPDKIALGWHEGQNLNWQAQTMFAEEGKNVPSISYYDGSQKGRQSVTLSNSTGHPIVSESLYDYNGRPALNVMPAPSEQTHIGFHDNWSLQSPGVPYTKAHFDIGDCSVTPPPMNNNGGAARYYSSKNFLLPQDPNDPDYAEDLENAGKALYIPDSEGYPYAITEYTPDGTGRIKRQSGVGLELKMDSGHETKYYYARASQQEIDRLFGNSIGHESHYFKNMVIDPNKQASVSYTDAHGRTIATALAGGKPDGLDEIEGYGIKHTIIRDLLSDIRRDNRLVSNYTFLVTEEQNHAFSYILYHQYEDDTGLQALSYKPSCYVNTPKCYDCGFDVKVTISDNCGNAFNGGSPQELFNFSNYFETLNYDCNPFFPLLSNESVSLPIGEYKVRKELVLNETVLEEYLGDFLSEEECLPSYNDILNNLINQLDITSCEVDCNSCEDDVPEISSIRDHLLGTDYTMEEYDNATLQAEAIQQALLEQCDLMCNAVSECEIMEEMMEADMHPGGQYALYDYDLATNTYSVNDPTSILYNNKYQDLLDGAEYLDELGNPDMIYFNGELVKPTEVDLATFIVNFKSSWARPLVEKYHPEYCYLAWCEDESNGNYESDQWDANLYDIETYAEAVAEGIIDAEGNFLNDPFFNGGPGADCIAEMQAYLDHVIPYDENSPSLLELVEESVWGVDCETEFGEGTDAENDLAWQLLYQMYLSFKMQVMASKWDAIAGCDNSCIGNGELFCGGVDCINTDAEGALINLCNSGNINYYRDKESRVQIIHPYNTTTEPVTVEDLYQMMEDATGAIVASCQDECTTSADAWLLRLEACIAANPGVDVDALRNDLIAICQYSCDVSHPGGASSIPFPDDPNLIDPPAASFVAVIQSYFGSDVCDLVCNPYLIDYPRPYGEETYLGARPVNSLSNSCICERLNEVESYFTNPDAYAVDSEEYREALSTFLLDYSEAPLRATDILIIKEQCNSTQASLYLPHQIYIPPYLECGTCVTKADIQNILDNIEGVNGSVIDLGTDCGATGATLEELEAIYLNYQLGFQLTAAEYQAFMNNTEASPHLLCPQTPFEIIAEGPNCVEQLYESVLVEAQLLYDEQIEALKEEFINEYYAFCLSNVREKLNVRTEDNTEYHYTLYYYDQAGNLVQTIPPAGVVPLATSELEGVVQHRESPDMHPAVYPAHDPNLVTAYKYNSFNEIIEEQAPDVSVKQYWYDPLGRVYASQDGRQQDMVNGSIAYYSYTEYDELGRIVEVGEVSTSQSPDQVDWSQGYDVAITNWTEDAQASKSYITHTFYDVVPPFTIPAFGPEGQQNLRTRISSVTFDEVGDTDDNTYDYASHYSYDAVGNVKVLVQEIQELATYGTENQYKVIEYDYDHISGKVNAVKYQEDEYDQFTHRYRYDEDNRLIEVWTSEEEVDNDLSILWTRDAAYDYYLHGPLARKELGHYNVQGMDYAYTLQGWIKMLNSGRGLGTHDMGKDGIIDAENMRSLYTARDAYFYALGYFEEDYKPIGPDVNLEYVYAGSGFNAASPSLYNGNIRNKVHVLYMEESLKEGEAYTYDQLHRLKSMNVWSNMDGATDSWLPGGSPISGPRVDNITYDANGNIQSLTRRGFEVGGAIIDDLTYNYSNSGNQLISVNDASTFANVFKDQLKTGLHSYEYDNSGNLTRDVFGEMDITWTPYGKVADVDNFDTEPTYTKFGYGPDQNRWKRYEHDEEIFTATTFYIRDAQGNVMAVYEDYDQNGGGQAFHLREQHLYGSSRLGVYVRKLDGLPTQLPSGDGAVITAKLGQKRYEVTNHLGNVMQTISDRKKPISLYNDGSPLVAEVFYATLLNSRNYFPFGMEINSYATAGEETTEYLNNWGRTYRYGFNGKENDGRFQWGGATHYDYGFRIYNPAIGRFLSVDPLTRSYPELTPYQFAQNSPIVAIDLDGLEAEGTNEDINETFQGRVLPTVNISAKAEGSNYDQSYDRYGSGNLTWSQYQKQYGLEGWSYENYSSYYDNVLSGGFDDYVAEQDRIERERVAMEKLTIFTAPFKALENIVYFLPGGQGVGLSIRGSSLLAGRVIQSPITGNVLVSGRVSWGIGGKLNGFNLTPTPKDFYSINSNYPAFGYTDNCSNCVSSVNNLLQFGEFSPALPLSKGVTLTQIEAQYGATFSKQFTSASKLGNHLSRLPNNTHIGVNINRGLNGAHIVHGQIHSGYIKILDAQPRGVTYPFKSIEGGYYKYINTTGKIGLQIK
ncbi:MAG: hypothetical protein MI974_29165 [Chitinophagales bacterium]|nr:hypothetical protein [Chitinophagales bacterium]